MQSMRSEVCYKILDYEPKRLQIQLPLIQLFRGLHEFSFLEIYIYVDKATLLEKMYLKQYLILSFTKSLSNIFLLFLRNHHHTYPK